jgi:hypothetical protein
MGCNMEQATYDEARRNLLKNRGRGLEALEQSIFKILLKGLCDIAPAIKRDFDLAMDLRPFWEKYAPLQRGHKPRGEAFPWGEVGEKVIEGYLYSNLGSLFGEIRFPGLPYGHDVRFLTGNAFVQVDIKSTGPTDNPDEVVSSPNQVTGDGLYVGGLTTNTAQTVQGKRKTIAFRPELSPFVVLSSKVYPVVTYYIKVAYLVLGKGDQPLHSLELVCVPNGLLMFDGPKYGCTPDLLIPGKDIQGHERKRTRIRLFPLAQLADWRCVKLIFAADGFTLISRLGNPVTV